MKKIRDRLNENHIKQREAHVMLGSQNLLNVLDIKPRTWVVLWISFFSVASFSRSKLGMTLTLLAVEVFGWWVPPLLGCVAELDATQGTRESWIWEEKWPQELEQKDLGFAPSSLGHLHVRSSRKQPQRHCWNSKDPGSLQLFSEL